MSTAVIEAAQIPTRAECEASARAAAAPALPSDAMAWPQAVRSPVLAALPSALGEAPSAGSRARQLIAVLVALVAVAGIGAMLIA